MKVYGQLEKAQAENAVSDTASHPAGMLLYRTDLGLLKVSNGTLYKTYVDTDTAQTLSGKIFSNIEINGSVLIDEIATPANPSANEHKLYFKADGNFYTLDSSGNETPVGSGGGGGGASTWSADSAAPESVYENNELVYKYTKDMSQSLTMFVKVPQSYIAGRQIKAYLGFYTAATSNVWRAEILGYLIQKNVDAITDSTDFESFTSGDITNTVANQYREVTINITDASGQIGGTAVAPGDLLKLSLLRDVPTGTDMTEDLVFMPNTTEITFS